MKYLTGLVLLVAWIIGMVFAKGFWSTLFAVIMPIWSFYLVVEKAISQYF